MHKRCEKGARMFDIVIIGNGLLGASAGRHLAESGASVCLVGPNEPLLRAEHTGVFSSHYDMSRISRITDRDPFYAQIAAASIARYGELEQRSGHTFFSPVGHLVVTTMPNHLADLHATVRLHRVDATSLSGQELANRFPHLRFAIQSPGDDIGGILERSTAGYLDPRAFIAAQLSLVASAGGSIVRATANAIIDGDDGPVVIRSDDGRETMGRKVLVATGAFANHLQIVPTPVAVEIEEHTVVLARVAPSDAHLLNDMPTIIYKRGPHPGESVYVIPPVRYPDGHLYLKIGQSSGVPMMDPGTRLQPWFRSDGDPDVRAWLTNELTMMFPTIGFTALRSESCAVTKTPNNRPTIDRFGETQIYALLGGNGAAAKSADELGRIASELVLSGHVPAEYVDQDFTLHYQ